MMLSIVRIPSSLSWWHLPSSLRSCTDCAEPVPLSVRFRCVWDAAACAYWIVGATGILAGGGFISTGERASNGELDLVLTGDVAKRNGVKYSVMCVFLRYGAQCTCRIVFRFYRGNSLAILYNIGSHCSICFFTFCNRGSLYVQWSWFCRW